MINEKQQVRPCEVDKGGAALVLQRKVFFGFEARKEKCGRVFRRDEEKIW